MALETTYVSINGRHLTALIPTRSSVVLLLPRAVSLLLLLLSWRWFVGAVGQVLSRFRPGLERWRERAVIEEFTRWFVVGVVVVVQAVGSVLAVGAGLGLRSGVFGALDRRAVKASDVAGLGPLAAFDYVELHELTVR